VTARSGSWGEAIVSLIAAAAPARVAARRGLIVRPPPLPGFQALCDSLALGAVGELGERVLGERAGHRTAQVLEQDGHAAERPIGRVPARLAPGLVEAGAGHGAQLGLAASIRAIAASTSSAGLTSPR
jgi:hypothetical protein